MCGLIFCLWNANALHFPGEALLESNTVIDFVYCSPALRCVQTAQNILKGKRQSGLYPQLSHWHSEKGIFYLCGLISFGLCKQVCSRMVSWRCEWNRGFLNGPSGCLGALCLRGYLPLTWLLPTLVSTQLTGDANLSQDGCWAARLACRWILLLYTNCLITSCFQHEEKVACTYTSGTGYNKHCSHTDINGITINWTGKTGLGHISFHNLFYCLRC